MKILHTPAKKIAIPVSKYSEIKPDAEAMVDMLDIGKFPGKQSFGISIAHSQVSENPQRFFVVKKEVVMDKILPFRVIINPVINEKDKASQGLNLEGCLSFPYRDSKDVLRYNRVKVSFIGSGGEEIKEHWIEGLAAAIFQHEIDHMNCVNIYQKNGKS